VGNFVPEVKIVDIPFLFRDYAHARAVLDGPIGQDLLAKFPSKGLIALAWGENGFREISNSKRVIRTPADLRGLKIRFAAGNIFKDIYEGLGANPVQMSFADLQPALSTGAVDGQENPVNLFLAFRMDTLAQKHLSVWNYVNDPLVFAAGKQVMAQFNAADQALVRECALEAGRYEIGVTRKGLGDNNDRSAFEELTKRGVETTVLTDAEKRAFASATRPVFDKWAATIGHDLVQKAERVIRAAS
jgi:TRAP-type C4-dicarboxylate transport system substrate-binding protein